MKKIIAIVAAAVLAMSLGACSSSDTAATDASASADNTIVLGFIPAWTDGLSTAYLLKNQLEKMGYTVEMQELSEAGVLYTALAKGDVDIYPSAWPEVTHASYMEKYGADIEDLDTYYDNAKLTLAVPEYTDITSIEDLAGNADMFGGKIVGIEPGAGLTKVVQENVIPDYGLSDDYELVTSSTTAMLAELKSATDSGDDIVVTLWRPFWANSAFNVKDLEDPKGALGKSEGLHFLGHAGFSEEYPDVATLIASIHMTDESYGDLENLVVNEYGEGRYDEAIEAWLTEHPESIDAVQS